MSDIGATTLFTSSIRETIEPAAAYSVEYSR